jgi:small-conductance mechanosensitive channel
MTFPHLQHRWFLVIFLFCAALVVANLAHYLIFRILRRRESQANTDFLAAWGIQRYLGRPARAVFLITCIMLILPSVPRLPGEWEDDIHQALIMALIVSLGWVAAGSVYVFQSLLLRRYDLHEENNVRARRVHTQFQLFRRLLLTFVVVITIGTLLWSFHDQRIWHYGTGLLASAGVASLVLATAAKSTAANLLAGFQIALSEPIRLDDVVIVQGEWGRIEEITTAYVVVRIWDQRRLIVPLTYFIENTFQNWTRESAEILGTAFLYVDYSIPVEELRIQLNLVVHPSKLWDGRVCGLQVTNLSEKSMEIRCLMSSRNASESFDLRCIVREEMTAWIQQHYPEAFPTMRLSSRSEETPTRTNIP